MQPQKSCVANGPQKDEASAAKSKAAAAEDAQKAIADMMVQAQAQMAKETGTVSHCSLPSTLRPLLGHVSIIGDGRVL